MLALLPLLVSTGWVALLITTPLMPGWAGAVVYGFCAFICHQIPERSFHLAGVQLPVCARCLGIYLGVSGGVAYAWLPITGRAMLPTGAREFRRLAAVAAAPTVLTVVLEVAGVWYPSNGIRALAGFPFGILVALVLMNALQDYCHGPSPKASTQASARVNYDECVPPRPTVPKPPPRSI